MLLRDCLRSRGLHNGSTFSLGRIVSLILDMKVLALYAEYNAEYTIKNCNGSKVCVHAPPGCNGIEDCTVIFSFLDNGAEVELELLGKPPTEQSKGFEHISAIISDDETFDHGIVYFCARCEGSAKGGLAVKDSKGLSNIEVSVQGDEGRPLAATSTDNLLYCKTRPVADMREAFFVDNFSIALVTGTFSESDLCRDDFGRDVLSPTSSRSIEHLNTTGEGESSACRRARSMLASGKFACSQHLKIPIEADNRIPKVPKVTLNISISKISLCTNQKVYLWERLPSYLTRERN